MELVIDQTYKRTDLHDYYGGQRQGGISTPKDAQMILIFSSDKGHAYGYKDGWTENDEFLYTGEGQVGDMQFSKGNRAIRDHEANGKELHLFIYERTAYVKYKGEFKYLDHELFRTKDREGAIRNAIKFTLVQANGQQYNETPQKAVPPYKKPSKTERKGLVTSRVGQGYYRQEILQKFDGKCAASGSCIKEILIASHILPWSLSTTEERLDVENGILLSPNYDALFDKHLISFDDDGKIVLSERLSQDDCIQLGIDTNASIEVTEGMKDYLRRHRENL